MRVYGELLNAQLENLNASPAGTPTGRIYFDTVLTVPVYWNGSAWISLTTVSIPATAGGVYSTGAAFSSVAFAGHANYVFGVTNAGTGAEYKNLVVGTAGTDFAVAHTAGVVTFNLPDASASNRGAVTTGAQTFAGTKTFTGKLLLADGSGGQPAYGFSSETNSGFYWVGAAHIRVQLNGSTVWDWTATAMNSTLPMRLGDGSGGNPTYSFSGETNTGVYRVGASHLGFIVGGNLNADVDATGLNTTALNCAGAASAASLNLNSGGAFKVKLFSGTLAASASTTLSITGTIIGVIGQVEYNGAGINNYYPLNTNTTLTIVPLGANTDGGSFTMQNVDAGHTNHYRITIFYS